ncbi:MAG: sugar ABC transporter substrate-binding protein [Oligoflexia bacterium]|nr:sugar ABC transporter substrate-binding protein [Oligoflexia bacterium]
MIKSIVLIFLSIFCITAHSKFNLLFVTKSYKTDFFKEIEKGCLKAAKDFKVNCIFVKMNDASSREQYLEIQKAMKDKKIDALAIAIINSKFTAKQLKSLNIPYITIDADYARDDFKKYDIKRLSYIGTNNYDLGRVLADKYLKMFDTDYEVCIISGHEYSDNLNHRIRGFKDGLKKSKKKIVLSQRCPLYCNENKDSAISKMNFMSKITLKDKRKLTIAFMGGWAQFDHDLYVNTLKKYEKQIKEKKLNIISIDTLETQKRLVREGWSHLNVGQDPWSMGYMGVKALVDILNGKRVNEIKHTPITICTKDKC